jgi:hypothetical protein
LYAIKPRNRTHRIREALWQRLGLVYDLYDAAHARNAKARAAQQVKAGNLSKADKKKVDAKADKVLNKKSRSEARSGSSAQFASSSACASPCGAGTFVLALRSGRSTRLRGLEVR